MSEHFVTASAASPRSAPRPPYRQRLGRCRHARHRPTASRTDRSALPLPAEPQQPHPHRLPRQHRGVKPELGKAPERLIPCAAYTTSPCALKMRVTSRFAVWASSQTTKINTFFKGL